MPTKFIVRNRLIVRNHVRIVNKNNDEDQEQEIDDEAKNKINKNSQSVNMKLRGKSYARKTVK